MSDGTLITVDGRPALRFERALAHPTERVWRAVSEPAEVEQWMPGVVPWTPAAGETFDAGGMTLEVTEVDAPTRLAWRLGDDRYSIDLAADGDGTRLVFLHVFDGTELAAQAATGWHAYLRRLDVLLDGDYLSEEDAHQGWAETHERYAAAFGRDPEPRRRVAAALAAQLG